MRTLASSATCRFVVSARARAPSSAMFRPRSTRKLDCVRPFARSRRHAHPESITRNKIYPMPTLYTTAFRDALRAVPVLIRNCPAESGALAIIKSFTVRLLIVNLGFSLARCYHLLPCFSSFSVFVLLFLFVVVSPADASRAFVLFRPTLASTNVCLGRQERILVFSVWVLSRPGSRDHGKQKMCGPSMHEFSERGRYLPCLHSSYTSRSLELRHSVYLNKVGQAIGTLRSMSGPSRFQRGKLGSLLS